MGMKYDLKLLTVDEKIQLLMGKNTWQTKDIDGKLPSLFLSDGPSGLRRIVFEYDENGNTVSKHTAPATAMPAASSLSYTWSPELARLDGEVIADECIEKNADVLLAPGVNIKRTPLCGRNFEYFSEDPLVAGKLAKAFIEGVQSRNVGTSLKHFCVNNAENDRSYKSTEIDERTLREIYLPAFERALEAKPWTVMCSYNPINGVWASENNKILRKLLREELGFEGLIVSDWGAVHDMPRAVKAGVDLTMPYRELYLNELREAYARGEVTEAEIDECCERVLRLIELCESRDKEVKMSRNERHGAAKRIADEAIVLLKNDNNTLPLKGGKIYVEGGFAKKPPIGGGGSSLVTCDYSFVPLGELVANNLGDCCELVSANGRYTTTVDSKGARALPNILAAAMRADTVVLAVGNDSLCESESFDRTTMRLDKRQEDAIIALSRAAKKLVVVLYTGTAIDMSAWIDKVSAVVLAGYAGEAVNEAVADVLTGKVCPSGKITETYPLTENDVPVFAVDTTRPYEVYSDGVLVGYRHYDYYEKEVLFPFGHGLSYTSFEYSNLKVDKQGESDYTVSFDVTNTGAVDGKEVCQIYVSDLLSMVIRPVRELRAFEKVMLRSGETKRISISLSYRDFAYYSTAHDSWHVENGEFEILVGASSRDIRLSERIDIQLPREKQHTLPQ